MAGDWVKIHRAMMEHAVWESDWLVRLFLWCIFKASYADRKVFGVDLKKGQFITGRSKAADELGVDQSRWYRGMQKLQEYGCVVIESNSNRTTVTVCNYETYQAKDSDDRTAIEQQSNSNRTAIEQQSNTKEEINNSKKGKKGRREEHSNAAGAAEVVIPESLSSEVFLSAWSLWLEYRKERRLTTRQATLSAQLDALAPLGPEAAARCVLLSRQNGWQGIFPDKVRAQVQSDPRGNMATVQKYLQELENGERV